MKTKQLFLFLMLTLTGISWGQTTDLFISEYAEGTSGNSKYIEIYNGTGGAIDLSNYRIWIITNGGNWPETSLTLSGNLANGATYVIANNSSDVPSANLYNTTVTSFNGDDAVGLAKNISSTWTLIDAIGTSGSDPGTGWAVAGTTDATANNRLTRKNTICSPNTDWVTSAGTTTANSEWVISSYATGSASSGHTANCSASTPTLTTTSSALTGLNYVIGSGPSAEQTFTVAGSNLTDNITITPPTNYEISTASGGSFVATNPITLTQAGGSVANTPIYVRLKAGLPAANYNSEVINITSTGAATKTVTCSGSVTAPTPTITLTGSLTSFGNQCINIASTEQTYSVSGSNLTNNIVVTAPSHYEVSVSSGSGFGSTVTLTQTGGVVTSQTIYVRFNPTSTGSKTGNISHTSSGATTVNQAVAGTGTTTPTLTTTAISNINTTTATTGGNVTVAGGANVTAKGVCWNTTGNPTISDSSTNDGINTGSYTSNLTGLAASTTYYVRAYATNACGTSYGGLVSFTTLSIPETVPYLEDFEGATSEWLLDTTDTNKWAIGTATNNGGSKALYISNNNGVDYAYTITSSQNAGSNASFRIDLTGLTNATLFFDWKANGEETFDYGEVYINTGGSDILLSTTKEFYGSTVFANKSISLNTYCGSIVTIKFRWKNDGSAGDQPPFAVDNIQVLAGSLPTVSTTGASAITSSTISTGGNITNDGGLTITNSGVCYSTTPNPTLSNSVLANGATTGVFTSNLTNLLDNTTYYLRAYATNSLGTSYGTEISFTTSIINAPTATAATNVGNFQFDANWNSVVGATQYRLDVSDSPTFGNLQLFNITEGFENGLPGSYTTSDKTLDTGVWSFFDAGLKAIGPGQFYAGLAGCQMKASTGKVTAPAISNIGTISFYAKANSGTSTMAVSKIINGTTTLIETITITNSWTQYSVPVNDASNNIRISFQIGSTYGFIDAVTINYSTGAETFLVNYENKDVSTNLTHTVTGLNDNKNYYYRVRAVGNNSTSSNSNIISVTTPLSTTTWVSTNGGEWTNGAPTTVTDAIIDFPYNTTTAPIIAENLTVTTNGTLTVSATNPVTIHGNLINTNATAGAINVLNGGTLLQPNNTTTNGNTGNITYNRNTANLQNNDFVYWSSPVSGAKATSMGSIDKIYDFNHSSQAWNHINLNPTANPLSSITLANGVGYAVRFIGASNNPNTAAFEGVPNNGDVTITGITSSGAEKYMLLGNPYPSALDLEGLQNDNAAVLGQTFYFWTHANAYNGTNYNDADYATYNVELGAGTAGTNNGTAGTRYVSAGQGFFADLNSAGMSSATLTFKNSHRVGDNNTNFFRSAATQTTTQNTSAAKIWFNFKNENAFKQTLLAYTPNATNGYDPVDATTFDGQPYVDFYTLADNKKMVIQARAPFVNTDIVPMGYRVSHAGTYTIEIDHLDNVWNSQNIYLNDKQLNVVHDIKANPYSFTTPAGVFDTRFEIIYQTNALSNPDVSFDKAVIVFAKDKNIHINSSLETIKEVVVYDLQGRIITTKTNINATQAILTNVRAEEQVLLVKVTSTEGKITTKKVVF